MPREKSQSLHSRYNPMGEAERYIEALALKSGIRYFILIEPGLGYLVPALKAKNPNARVIALHVSEEASCRKYRADASWDPLSGIPAQLFLENEIPDLEAANVKIIEWRPALAVYGEAYVRLLSEAAVFVKRADANARTVKTFGRRWMRNFFRNLLLVSECINPARFDLPVIAAGAGPGLEEAIPLISRAKEKVKNLGPVVLAVSSAVAALKAGGVEPDLVIGTDGGGWARLHLFEYYRGPDFPNKKKRFLAAPMTAALPSHAAENPLLILSDGSLWQNTVLKGLGLPFISLPQRGTVSASALDLAFCLSAGKVFLCGVDLAHRDLQTHARPYSFDRLWEEKASRFHPFYSQIFSRSLEIKSGGSHGIYASWFAKEIENYPKRLYSLGTNNPVFGSLAVSSIDFNDCNSEKDEEKNLFNPVSINFKENPVCMGAALLAAALKDPDSAEKLTGELRPLLFPERENVSPEELAEALFSLTKPYRNVNHGRNKNE